MPKNYQFTCNKDPISMDIGDNISIFANDRRHAYRLLCKKLGFKVKIIREKPKEIEDPNQRKFDFGI